MTPDDTFLPELGKLLAKMPDEKRRWCLEHLCIGYHKIGDRLERAVELGVAAASAEEIAYAKSIQDGSN